jgi:1-aminocyclopropane-1-carboxylate deaminase/D-cysteine desulfhydrase-like pyridoxal-dependent ACC family enzyme
MPDLQAALDAAPRSRLATLPTPLQRGPELPGGARLWVKRDDLTGLGLGGNKARKLEFLCGDALARGATAFVTVGAGQSNHTRQTAAAGAVLGVRVRLLLGDAPPDGPLAGNQLLSALFGAAQVHAGGAEHVPGTDPLQAALDAEREAGREPALFPLGGSTHVGARGFALAWLELAGQCRAAGIAPRALVHATSSGGTHAGLLAGRAAGGGAGPEILAVGVGKLLGDLRVTARDLARECLRELGLDAEVPDADAVVDWAFEGEGYAVPTAEADAAIRWAAERMALVLDRVYSGKALAGLLAHAEAGRWGPGDDVVFWHTGGVPAVFAPGGAPE